MRGYRIHDSPLLLPCYVIRTPYFSPQLWSARVGTLQLRAQVLRRRVPLCITLSRTARHSKQTQAHIQSQIQKKDTLSRQIFGDIQETQFSGSKMQAHVHLKNAFPGGIGNRRIRFGYNLWFASHSSTDGTISRVNHVLTQLPPVPPLEVLTSALSRSFC